MTQAWSYLQSMWGFAGLPTRGCHLWLLRILFEMDELSTLLS